MRSYLSFVRNQSVKLESMEFDILIKYDIILHLGVVHNCQHLKECPKHTFPQTPPPPSVPHQKLHTSTFFKWKYCHDFFFLNGLNVRSKFTESKSFSFDTPPPSPKSIYFVHAFKC